MIVKKEISKQSNRCKSCSNKYRKGKYKFSVKAKENISNSKIGKPSWNKGLNHNIDKRIKIKPLEKIIHKKYGLRQEEWIKFSKEFRLNFDKCYTCKKSINLLNSDIDHKIPYKISKDNSIKNLLVLCKSCHAKKTYHKDKIALWGVNH